jgi:hypothetical protein
VSVLCGGSSQPSMHSVSWVRSSRSAITSARAAPQSRAGSAPDADGPVAHLARGRHGRMTVSTDPRPPRLGKPSQPSASLSDIVATFPHLHEPRLRNRAQVRHLLVQPDVDGRITFDCAGEPNIPGHCTCARRKVGFGGGGLNERRNATVDVVPNRESTSSRLASTTASRSPGRA